MHVKLFYGLVKLKNWFMVSSSVDINELLNQKDSEDKAGGALEEVDKLVKNYGAAGVNIVRNAFVYVLLICMIASAIGLAVHGNNVSKRSEEKSGMGWKIAAGVVGFAAVGLITLVQTIGEGLF